MPGQDPFAAALSIEALSVIFAAALVWLSALIQHVGNLAQRGAGYVISDRSGAPPLEGFPGRATRTLANNVESALMWAPPILIILLLRHATPLSHVAAAAYIGARIIFSLSYWLRIPVVRSLAWFAGMICCAVATVLAVVPAG